MNKLTQHTLHNNDKTEKSVTRKFQQSTSLWFEAFKGGSYENQDEVCNVRATKQAFETP